MENPEEILHSLEEFSKLKPKDIPRELEEYLCFVAKTGDPVYQWGTVKSLFKEKLINVITDFYESCPSVEIPPCPNVEVFNYESMKTFILEKLDTFAAAPFTVQRICELLTTPRKEYNRIDKYMRALEKNILVVSTTEPGNRRTTENGEGIVNGLESEHLPETNNSNNDINVEEMDDTPVWSRITPEVVTYQNTEPNVNVDLHPGQATDTVHPAFVSDSRTTESTCGSSIDSVITCRPTEEQPYVSIEPVASDSCLREENVQESDVTVTITAIPAAVQKRRDSIEPVVSTGEETAEQTAELVSSDIKENLETSSSSSPSPSPSPPTVATEAPLQENLSCEAETSNAEDTSVTNSTSSTTNTNKEQPDSPESNLVSELTEPTPNEASPIQIPIISEITSGLGDQNVDDNKEPSILNSQIEEDSNLRDGVSVKEQTESDIEAIGEISTTVTSTDGIEKSQPVISENSPTLSVSKESSVSSTDDISNDASDVELKNNQLDQIDDESRSYDQESPQEDSSVDSVSNTDSNIETEEVQGKQSAETVLHSIQEFASSSNSQDSMDVDTVEEETCQEAPTSDG